MATGVFKGEDILVIGSSADFNAILNRVQGFGFDPSWDTEEHGQYGDREPLEINKTYDGVSGSLDLEDTAYSQDANPAQTLQCILTNQDPNPANALVVGFDPANYDKFDIVANVWNGDPRDWRINTILKSFFVKQAEVSGAPMDSTLDGVATKTVDYDAVTGLEMLGAATYFQHVLAAPALPTDAIQWDSAGLNPFDDALNPKTRGVAVGYENQLDPLTALGRVALIAAMKPWINLNYHVYAGYSRGGIWKELKQATSDATEFVPGEALDTGDILRVLVLFDDDVSIV